MAILTPVRSGSVKLPIYENHYSKQVGRRKRKYTQYTVAYFDQGRRKLKKFSDKEEAKKWAEDRAALIDSGRRDVAKMAEKDREAYVHAVRALNGLDVPLHVAAEEYAACVRLLPPGTTLKEAVQDFAARYMAINQRRTVAEVVEEFIAEREQTHKRGQCSIRDLQTVRSHLRRFAASMQKEISMVQDVDVAKWLRENAVAEKSWNNMRISLVRLFNFARDHRYLPKNVRTAAEETKRKKEEDPTIVALPPASLSKMLEGASAEARLYLALGAFTGIRAESLPRLQWEWFDFTSNVIRMPRMPATKERKRSIPIQPNLRAFLDLHANRKGPVFSSEKVADRTISFVKEKGMDWPQNWARESYISYRVAITKSVGQVALESSNSEAIIKKHYHDADANEADAKLWFAIMPDVPANVVPMGKKGVAA